jgi:hypothetical protein
MPIAAVLAASTGIPCRSPGGGRAKGDRASASRRERCPGGSRSPERARPAGETVPERARPGRRGPEARGPAGSRSRRESRNWETRREPVPGASAPRRGNGPGASASRTEESRSKGPRREPVPKGVPELGDPEGAAPGGSRSRRVGRPGRVRRPAGCLPFGREVRITASLRAAIRESRPSGPRPQVEMSG